jgi:hypothetical protein
MSLRMLLHFGRNTDTLRSTLWVVLFVLQQPLLRHVLIRERYLGRAVRSSSFIRAGRNIQSPLVISNGILRVKGPRCQGIDGGDHDPEVFFIEGCRVEVFPCGCITAWLGLEWAGPSAWSLNFSW